MWNSTSTLLSKYSEYEYANNNNDFPKVDKNIDFQLC